MKGVQCYELFGGIALKNHAFSFSLYNIVFQIGSHETVEMLLVHSLIVLSQHYFVLNMPQIPDMRVCSVFIHHV